VEFSRGQLLYFVTVAEEGQITRAAQKLYVAQPALSQAIARLESDLGIELFERHARGVTLTPAGAALLVKARAAVSAWADAVTTAQSLARASRSTIEFGFLGVPPALVSPDLLEAFAEAHPGIDLRYRELPFPSSPTSTWIAAVDVALCHRPPPDAKIWTQELRREARVVLAPTRHPLARRNALDVADVIDETFIGFHPSVEPVWAGFWSLDDHRGASPRHVTPDRVSNPQEVLASLAVRSAITTVTEAVARVISNQPTGLVSIPLGDAERATIMLVGHEDRRNPHVATLRAFVDQVTGSEAKS
jgi:DNA-binding transcriptional LysR family regulator